MARRTPGSTTLLAGLAGILVLAGLLGWGMLGDERDDRDEPAEATAEVADAPSEDTPAEAEEQPLPELEEGFEAIAAADFFRTIAEAQQAAGSWEVSSVVVADGEETPVVRQQLSYHDDGADFRIQMPVDENQVEDGVVEGLYVDEVFYLKGLNPARWDENWYQVPNDDEILATFESTLQGTAAANFATYGEPTSYEVVGIEDVTELDDDVVRAVHYRIEIDPSTAMGASAGQGEMLTMDLWVDGDDRPVQVESVVSSGGEEYRSALYYSDYGADFDLAAPAPAAVTERRPPSMRSTD